MGSISMTEIRLERIPNEEMNSSKCDSMDLENVTKDSNIPRGPNFDSTAWITSFEDRGVGHDGEGVTDSRKF